MNYIVSTDKVTLSTDSTNIAVDTTAVIYTKAMKLRYAVAFALRIQATSSAGTPDIKVEIEEGVTLPTTEGAADTTWATGYVVPDGMANIYASLADELVHLIQLTPVVAEYIRFKITGNAANPSDTIVTAQLITQQPV
jgi:hypothetical protein